MNNTWTVLFPFVCFITKGMHRIQSNNMPCSAMGRQTPRAVLLSPFYHRLYDQNIVLKSLVLCTGRPLLIDYVSFIQHLTHRHLFRQYFIESFFSFPHHTSSSIKVESQDTPIRTCIIYFTNFSTIKSLVASTLKKNRNRIFHLNT